VLLQNLEVLGKVVRGHGQRPRIRARFGDPVVEQDKSPRLVYVMRTQCFSQLY
jgi:ribosomal protein L35AE/L33A